MLEKEHDFKLNYPSLLDEKKIFKDFISRKSILDFRFPPYDGLTRLKEEALDWLNISGLEVSNDNVLVANSGNHAIACILLSIKDNENPIIVTERFTYPVIKSLSKKMNIPIIPCEIDDEGIIIEDLKNVLNKSNAKYLYIQPTIHNPTCAVLPIEKRIKIAEIVREKDIVIIEDDAYRFLHPFPPKSFMELVPERTIHIESLSKPFNPLIKTAFIITPDNHFKNLKQAIIDTSSGSSILLSQLAIHLIENKSIDNLIRKKQNLAKKKQTYLEGSLKGLEYQTVNTAFHLWIKLPKSSASDSLVSELDSCGIRVSDGNAYRVDKLSQHTDYIRISIANEENLKVLKSHVEIIRNKILNRKADNKM